MTKSAAKPKKEEPSYTIDENGNVVYTYETPASFEPVPPGEYKLIIQNIEQRTGQDSQEPYFTFEFRTSTPDEDDTDNKGIWENISPQAGWRVTQLLESIYGPMEMEDGERAQFNIYDLFGATLFARIGLEEIEKGARKGEMRNCVLRFLPLVEGDMVGTAAAAPAKAEAKPAARKSSTSSTKKTTRKSSK